MRIKDILKKYSRDMIFLRPIKQEIINNIISGKDTLAIDA